MRRILLLQAFFLLAVLAGCARSRVEYQEIFRDERVHVRLAETLADGGRAVPKGFEHPWDVDIGSLEAMLASVRYKKGKVVFGGAKPQEVFPGPLRYRLLKPLQEAFAEAGPNQFVDFSFLDRRATLKVFQRVYLTDGVMFREGGKFNIAFRNMAYEDLGGGEEAEPNREDPMASPMRTSWTLVARDGQTLAKTNGSGLLGSNTYANWIELDLSWPWGVSDSEILERALTGTVEQLETVLEGELAPPEPRTPSREELQDRLDFLEELRRDGAIPEDAYQEKKRELDLLFESSPE